MGFHQATVLMVTVNLVLCLGVTAFVVLRLASFGWQRRFLLYSYELPLMALYAGHVARWPIRPVEGPVSVLYWMALLFSTNLVLIPLGCELWRSWQGAAGTSRSCRSYVALAVGLTLLFCTAMYHPLASTLDFYMN